MNQVVCHGIPSDDRVLKDGDIINIDVTVIEMDGTEILKMYLVGKVADHAATR